jgi:hypothetical protein
MRTDRIANRLQRVDPTGSIVAPQTAGIGGLC